MNEALRNLEKEIQQEYFQYTYATRQRIRLGRYWPEFWVEGRYHKRDRPLPLLANETGERRRGALEHLGETPARVTWWAEAAESAAKRMENLAADHPLTHDLVKIKGFGFLMAAKLIAVLGNPSRCETVSQFWSGMGLGLDAEGKVHRKTKGVKKTVPGFVTTVGEEIRTGLRMRESKFRSMYEARQERYPQLPEVHRRKRAIRETQKLLYATIWERWRGYHGLPAPRPYAFALLNHGSPVLTIADFWDR